MGSGCSVPTEEGQSLVSCKLWTQTDNESFVYPELRPENNVGLLDKMNLGIALSGGGFRACTAALGVVRGLNMLGIYSKARYISSNSGGSWLNCPLSYYNGDIEVLLGSYISPEQSTNKIIDECEINSHSYLLSKGNKTQLFIDKLAKGVANQVVDKLHIDWTDDDDEKDTLVDKRDFWSQTIGKIFFHSYGLNNYTSLPSLHNQDDEYTKACRTHNRVLVSCGSLQNKPYPIINGSMALNTHITFTPIEFTPMYYGLPARALYRDTSIDNLLTGKNDSIEIGGYLIQPHGFNVTLTSKQANELSQYISNNGSTLEIPLPMPDPSETISISEQAGISSSAPAQSMAKKYPALIELADMPVRKLWDPLSAMNQNVGFQDGGGVDNSGILALLRRGVDKIISCYAMNVSIADETINHCGAQSSFYNIAAMFGRAQFKQCENGDGVDCEHFNKLRHVFPAEDMDKLLHGLQANCHANKPAVYLLETTVLPNKYINVQGGYKVSIVFILIYASPAYIQALPTEVQERIKNDQEITQMENIQFLHGAPADLARFPYTSLKYFSYSSALVNLMSNLMTWSVLESKDILEHLLTL
jgi:hypothetical protein